MYTKSPVASTNSSYGYTERASTSSTMQFTVVPYRWNASTREGLYLRSVVCQPRLVRVAALAGFSSMSVSWSSR
uniref:Uncharacterized protein n=1 Tax=Human herpesvirus 1 TaxID=10298 RepID=A0A2Z4H832_HHV1|nr:hypothetical protein [Human alphaherpesvirus 1]